MPYRIDTIDPSSTALLVIDMQNDFLTPGAALETPLGRAMIPRLNNVIALCRDRGIPVIFTAHVHRADGTDMGIFAKLYPMIADRSALIDGTPGVEIASSIAREPGDQLIKKHRYSAFYGTDLDLILRGRGIRTVVFTGVTVEDCVHATARDAMFRNYDTVVLADVTATYDHADLGYGAMKAEEVHRASLVVLAQSTSSVLTAAEFEKALPQ
ncbi:cysteine hydrolase family protein [Nocardia arthritidis]|nr:isochorismatase family cysteine hydrolase [Nocardia arthritidis]